MNSGFADFAAGSFESGLSKLNEDPLWHDECTDLSGPFRLGIPGAQGWGEDLLVASLLKRNASVAPVKVITDGPVCHLLKRDTAFQPIEEDGPQVGRSPLAILRSALTGDLLEKPFLPLCLGETPRSDVTYKRPRVGIAWASIDDKQRIIREKSVPVNSLLDVLHSINPRLISLQRHLEVADPENLIHRYAESIVPQQTLDSTDVSAIDSLIQTIRELDFLVTISTTTTHIAASLGVRVELIAAERSGQQWFWPAQAKYQKRLYPTVQVHLGSGNGQGNWWENPLDSVEDRLRTWAAHCERR
jgi:hypothetical protein